jgi:hypothetical protein
MVSSPRRTTVLDLDDIDPIELLTPLQQEALRAELREMAEQRKKALNAADDWRAP